MKETKTIKSVVEIFILYIIRRIFTCNVIKHKINVFNNYAYITPTYIVPNNNPICSNNLNKVDNKNNDFHILL